eukprot:2109523-Pyramimonas_sp.AAC.1
MIGWYICACGGVGFREVGGEPIARREAVFTPRENQSQDGRQCILRVRTNRKRGGSIYSA